MKQLVYLLITTVLVQKVSVTARSLNGRDTLAVVSQRTTEGSGDVDETTVEAGTPCSDRCDKDGGECDNEGNCVCKQGRTGLDCSKKNGFPTNPAAKRDVTLSILAAILLVSLVVCALLPKHRISCPCLRRPKDDESENGKVMEKSGIDPHQ